MVIEREIESNDVLSVGSGPDPFSDRPGTNGTWIYRPSVASRGMDVEFVSYATVRDAIGEKSVTREVPNGATVETALQTLAEEFDGLDSLLFDGDGEVRPHINVLVGEENISALDGTQTELTNGATVGLAPGVSGGIGGEPA